MKGSSPRKQDTYIGLTLVVEIELLVDAASQEETSGVGGSVVGETNGDTIALELVGIGRGNADIVGEVSREDLGDNVLVGLWTKQGEGQGGGPPRLTMRMTKRYLGVLYLFLSWMIIFWRAW